MFQIIDSMDAKANLLELLRMVQEGRSFTITDHGKVIANLVPSYGVPTSDPIDAMLAFERVPGIAADEISVWIAEDRH